MQPATTTTAGASAISFDDVTCNISGKTILDRITLQIPRARITGILGPNGAGKTTLLSVVIGLRNATSGKITVLGDVLPSGLKRLHRRLGVVLQETALYDELTPVENLTFAAALYNVKNPKARIDEILDLLELSDRAGDRVSTLSGGMRRRIAIGRALLHSPELLVIDEPTLGVDVEARHIIWNHLRLLRAAGATVLVSTNYLDEVIALCDTVAVLKEGRLLTVETPQSLVDRAGSCLDIQCSEDNSATLQSALTGTPHILRFARTPTGLSIFLDGAAQTDALVRRALDTAPIDGFRIRGADLAEVFHAFE